MKSSLIRLITALAVCVVAILGYGAWYRAVAQKSAAVADLENQIKTKTEIESRIAVARAALNEISGYEASVQGYFVPETDAVAFIEDLEARGKAQKAVVHVLSVSTGKANGHSVLSLSVSVSGAFDAVMRSLGSIEYAPYDLTVSNLMLERGAEKENIWHANLDLVVGSLPAAQTNKTP